MDESAPVRKSAKEAQHHQSPHRELGYRRLGGFQLCYSITKCCFNGPPQVQHFVDCHVQDGANLEVYPNLVRIKGVLHVNVQYEAGKVKSVYQMDVESVDPG